MYFMYTPIDRQDDTESPDTEKSPLNSGYERRRTKSCVPWRTVLTALFALGCLLDLLANIVVLTVAGSNKSLLSTSLTGCDCDSGSSASFDDQLGHTNDTFYGVNHKLQSLDHKYDHLWDRELAGNNGIISLPELGPHEEGAISMFHQLHCLAGLRKALQSATEGKDIGVDWRDNPHWPHCLDYLWSTLLCNADSKIELPLSKEGRKIEAITGAWDKRECGNTIRLYELRTELGKMDDPPSYEDMIASKELR